MADRVYDEFAEELERWRERYRGRPRRELVRLFLLALEREQLVSVAYREDVIRQRLATMPIDDEQRDLLRHALLWVWKDEEMHAIYMRGALLRLGSAWLRIRSFVQQWLGAIGGWASSTRQHLRWKDAPFARFMATVVALLGTLLGKVPREVRKQLGYSSFRDFCRYNIEAERTAALCWRRIGEVAAGFPLPPEAIAEFERIRQDEDRHARIFGLFAETFDGADQICQDHGTAALQRGLAEVGEIFLPRANRQDSLTGSPLGTGGEVHVAEGGPHEKIIQFRRLLEAARLAEKLDARASRLGKAQSALRVAIKPTFMMGYDRKDRAVVSDPELVAELARFFQEQGVSDIAVVEAPNVYDRFYRHRTVADLARYFGFDSPLYRVVDLATEQVAHRFVHGLGQHTVGRTWKEADFRISFGKLRSHPVEFVYLCVANLEGIGGRGDEFLFAERQAHRDTAVLMLMCDFPPHFALLEGYDLAPDGLLGIMACRTPRSPRRLYAGADAMAVDLVAARHLGLDDVRRSQILRGALHWFGDPTKSIRILGTNQPVEGWRGPYHSSWSAFQSFWAYPVYQFCSGRGALFVPAMDPTAFPPLGREGFALRATRRTLQMLLSLRPPA